MSPKSKLLPGRVILSAVLVAACASAPYPSSQQQRSLCPAGAPHLLLTTSLGTILAEIAEQAVPQTARGLADLVRSGYYDGLRFEHTKPHVEIVTGQRAEEDSPLFPVEIDAGALGLDQQRIESAGEAMDTLQRELLKAFRDTGKKAAHPQLAAWLEAWYQDYDPNFLIGASRREINEALGYVYRDGLASLPVTEGALMLRPHSPREATPRLSIALQEIPQRTGRWMVVGRIVRGLDVAQEISLRPLARPPDARDRYTPLAPILIESLRFVCRPPQQTQ